MKRRGFLRSFGVVASLSASSLGTAGCLGMGGEAIVSIQQSITVDPGSGWTKEIPDISDSGGSISYRVRSEDRRFDVYFFVGNDQYEHYEAYVKGNDPSERPSGHDLGMAAVPTNSNEARYEAATDDGGAREPIEGEGPYYFVVDHSSYRMENRVEEYGDPLGAFVDLEVIEQQL